MGEFAKTIERRRIAAQLKRLNTIHDIHTGQHGTWRGKYKSLVRDYGIGLLLYYWSAWTLTGVGCYFALEVGGIDGMMLLMKFDAKVGTDMASKIDPTLGNIAMTVALNECLEPIRLPLVVTTTKPVVDFFSKSN